MRDATGDAELHANPTLRCVRVTERGAGVLPEMERELRPQREVEEHRNRRPSLA